MARTRVIGDRFAPVLRELQPLSERFAAAGHRLFLVGGTVRDLVLADQTGASLAPEFDIDATTTARPDEIKRCLEGWADAIWTQGERFGTIGATRGGRVYEITTHRAEAYQNHSRKPDVQFSNDIEADLSRRDFTVNAMAIDLIGLTPDAQPTLVDPFGGMHDLSARILRTPLSPEASFSDDPLRMLRAARFVARYELQPDPGLLRAVRAMGERMEIVSAERIHEELGKLLDAARPGQGLRFAGDTGLLQHVVPELAAAASQDDEACHDDLWAHTIDLVDAIAAPADGSLDRRTLRWAGLLRPLGASRARARMQRLRCSNDETAAAVRLIELAAPLLEHLAQGAAWTGAEVRRPLARSGSLRAGLHALVAAEAEVHAGLVRERLHDGLATLEAHIGELARREPLDDLGPQLSGDQVMAALSIDAGPAVGAALAHLGTVRLDEGILDEDHLITRLREWFVDHEER
ncbi:MAG: CCA tRNA nucleotidyltransferase [Actinobacteria bacterium]|nr:CCA tRNA nucleotidyltransferase [Actinomycetota bacterium]